MAVPTYSARNIADALDLLDIVTEPVDKALLGTKAAQTVDAHPERRFKAAFEAYKDRELPIARKEYPGLRLQQYNDLLFKQFEKHPDNPYNKLVVSYDATKEDKVAALKSKRKEVEDRLKHPPDKPFSKSTVSHDAVEEDKVAASKTKRKEDKHKT
ncbi:hypothetical protein CROQUDRAFT_652465 [Cronartium quercuum f. sp. fusiforme G11]|uniref:Coiled-coil domain-containing protein n=1 Tax=Cronartium quercuum f. sp. fusiforme G11 TaxID=708437 RepID=A0A9P6NU64_9BASI|nr:hypothetical protein CROQUDRAFT_652465 [Cronartium quercuum f. sp. fusiforme G11]